MRHDIFREPNFFFLPPRSWHCADLKHLIIFFFSSCFFHEAGTISSTEAFARRFYFFLKSYSFSTWTCLVHLDFSLTVNPGPTSSHSSAGSLLHSHWPKSKSSIFIYFSNAHAPPGYSSFRHATHAIQAAFPLYFVYLQTQVHILFWYPRNLGDLSKVNYVSKWTYFFNI